MIGIPSETDRRAMLEDLGGFTHDPLGYVLWNYDWGKGELQGCPGPRKWQAKALIEIGRRLKDQSLDGVWAALLFAFASGHGIGKGWLATQLVKWGLSTCPDSKFVVTANTEQQLKGKTWAELAKWHRLGRDGWMFTMTATSLYSNEIGHDKTWRADMVAWSEEKSEAFAGLHNAGRRLGVVMDEASAIPDKIWEVTEGALTDEKTEILWLALGNPTRNTGRFRECFGRFKHRWCHENIDARDVEGTNKAQMQKWIDDYGENSDFVKVRVRGQFPSASSLQFIDGDLVQKAMTREERFNINDPLVMALDIARGGDDNNVFTFRHGLDMRSKKQIVIPGSETRDSMRLVTKAVQLWEEHRPDVFFYDGTGVGGPVGDRLRQLGVNVVEIQFGAASPDPKYANMRAFIWGRFKALLENGLAIENHPELEADLTGVEYTHNNRDQLLLEKKEHMKERGLASPDRGDSAAMTAFPFHGKGSHLPAGLKDSSRGRVPVGDYEPYG